MGMLWRTARGIGIVLKMLFELLVSIAFDTVQDMGRIAGSLGNMLSFILYESSANPLFGLIMAVFMGTVLFFSYRLLKDSAKSVAVTLILAGIIFLVLLLLGLW